MGLLYDFTGQCAGNWDGETAPDGYWLRATNKPTTMLPLEFLDRIGPERFAAIWTHAVSNAAVAFPMVRGLAAQSIELAESFPALIAMEQMGLLPVGTAIEIWG